MQSRETCQTPISMKTPNQEKNSSQRRVIVNMCPFTCKNKSTAT